MGQCCTAENDKAINEELHVKSIHRRVKLKSDTQNRKVTKVLSFNNDISVDIEKNSLTGCINSILSRYTKVNLDMSNYDPILKSNDRFISKMRTEQLYNILIFHKDDFTESNYILLDLRPLQFENFLKKFRSVNYPIKNINSIKSSVLQNLNNFISNKKIIIAIENTSDATTVEKFVNYLQTKSIDCKVILLDTNLRKEISINNKFLIQILDTRESSKLPFILAPLILFPHLNSTKMIFLEYLDIDDYLNSFGYHCNDPRSSSNMRYNYINEFASFFKITMTYYITGDAVNIQSGNVLSTDGVRSINDLASLKSIIIRNLNVLSYQIDIGKSVLIVLDKELDEELKCIILIILVSYLGKVPLNSLEQITHDNLVFPNKMTKMLRTISSKLEDFLLFNFEIPQFNDYTNIMTTFENEISMDRNRKSNGVNKVTLLN